MTGDDERREAIRTMLEGGLRTEALPRADTHGQVQSIIGRLRAAAGDLKATLVIGGVTLAPVEHEDTLQTCESCMYYKVHRRYCELPELDMPVAPEWSCRLWRI